ncbi:hypothetical protein K9L97_04695 [Candidatus Woesearchaeota archaeon]|nr:hypothetical protein [Candidatus Woesearchaeota archaeon]
MKLKTPTLIILTLTLLIITGCIGQPNNNTFKNYNTGKQGVTIEFAKNMPPKEVYSGEEILLGITIGNKGSTDLTNETMYGILRISNGQDPFLTPKEEYQSNFKLKGKSEEYPLGEEVFIEPLRYKALQLNELLQTHEGVKIEASVCYPYKTKLTQSVCIDADKEQADFDPICRNQQKYTYSNGQGAPIAIKEIESQMIKLTKEEIEQGTYTIINNIIQGSDITTQGTTITNREFGLKPRYTITIENTKINGHPFLINDAETQSKKISGDYCNMGQETNINEVYITAKLGNYDLNCQNNIIKIGQKNQIICTLKEEDITKINRNYLTLLNIEIQYNYQETTTTELDIKRIVE